MAAPDSGESRAALVARAAPALCFALALAGCAQQLSLPPKSGLEKIEHIIVIYFENRSFDTRISAIIISPYARRGYVDHTTYDTTSIAKFITRRFELEPLPGVRAQMGDLTAAFDFAQ